VKHIGTAVNIHNCYNELPTERWSDKNRKLCYQNSIVQCSCGKQYRFRKGDWLVYGSWSLYRPKSGESIL